MRQTRHGKSGYGVLWHPMAHVELSAIPEAAERVAIRHVEEKLEAVGWKLGAPHSSAVRSEEGLGLRELRPRAGRSRWRPLYRRVSIGAFVILAIAPEATVDGRGFDKGIRQAKRRFDELEEICLVPDG